MYGLFGATKGYMPCKAVAASTTATGRAMIEETKAIVEDLGATVCYGECRSKRTLRSDVQTVTVCVCVLDRRY